MKTLLDSLTFEEKALLLSGAARMSTTDIERLGIEAKNFADGPHGVRIEVPGSNCTNCSASPVGSVVASRIRDSMVS